MTLSEREEWVGAACMGCQYGIAGTFVVGDGGPPVQDDGRKMTFFEGDWRCSMCMDDLRHLRRSACEAATARAWAAVHGRAAFRDERAT